jgi:hypothetical protein
MSSKIFTFPQQQEKGRLGALPTEYIYYIPHFIIPYFGGFVKHFGLNKLKSCRGLISRTAAKIAFDPAGSGALCQEK